MASAAPPPAVPTVLRRRCRPCPAETPNSKGAFRFWVGDRSTVASGAAHADVGRRLRAAPARPIGGAEGLRLSCPQRMRPEARRTSRNAHAPHPRSDVDAMAGCTSAVARAACMHTAAGCAAAAAEPVRIVGSALQRRLHSTTQSIGRCCRSRPRTGDEPALPGSALAHGALGVPRRAAGGRRSGPFSRSDPTRTIPNVTHAHATGGGRPGAIQLRTSLHSA